MIVTMPFCQRTATVVAVLGCLLTVVLAPASAAGAESGLFDPEKHMATSEVQPGMKGYGKTVVSGTNIETFQFEVVSVMTNAYYSKQDVILVRCAGLNLEHSGIVGGMSGSPCYITDEQGRERMIGAVAYGWSFNKDPLCGVQPIEQMLDVAGVRGPDRRAARIADGANNQSAEDGAVASNGTSSGASGGAVDIGELLARVHDTPLPESSNFSVFNDEIARRSYGTRSGDLPPGLRPLKTPLMVGGGGSPQVMSFLRETLGKTAFEPVASGGPSAATQAEASNIRLEPGSVLCIPLVTGDICIDALGTCTEVIGNHVLGFGHSMEGRGSIELPLATGFVHTVVPSVMRSNKLGASLNIVGTLWGDESSAVTGMVGKAPAMIPVEVAVENARGKEEYRFNVANDPLMTGELLAVSVLEAVYAHSQPPREHTVRYSIETEFDGLGEYRVSSMDSQSGVMDVALGVMLPTETLLNSPFGEGRVSGLRAEIKIEEKAALAEMEQVVLDQPVYKPGETIHARVRWAHYRNSPNFTEETYSLRIPDDLDDGVYRLMLTNARGHMLALRQEKPHLFRAENLEQLLAGLNRITSCPANRLYMRLSLPEGGMAVKSRELPELPSYLAKIYSDANRSDVAGYHEALVREFDTPFVVQGAHTLTVKVDRRADQ